ncbi:HEAT repeat domain-containing protein [Streptomyces sp. NBC_01283]|uniref:HEAT repeat domain-containing protein n=1 Tax=Streptomyces sp. NBC_01283 TaxID=2903812 RepID=UPI00352FAF41|nr:HEAT repeat domain-containing protein [Streptomyces sp. NBC_01283]
MFKERKARKQAELHERLAAGLRDPDVEVRRKAADTAAVSADPRWALRELAQAVEREPWAEEFQETVVDGFAAALRREAPVRERTERIFAAHLDDPEGFIRAWTGLTAELGGAPALREVPGDLRDDMRARLTTLRDRGWTAEGLGGLGRPDAFARELAFDLAILLASLVLRRNTPLPAEEADRVRGEARATLEKALPHAPGSAERAALLGPFPRNPEVGSWTDRARAGLRADEALALCASGEPESVTLGAEALAKLLFGEVVRRDQVLETLDHLLASPKAAQGSSPDAAPDAAPNAAQDAPPNSGRDDAGPTASPGPDPFLLSRILDCYSNLHAMLPLDAPPLDLFLDGLRHPDPRVRASAAEGLDPIAVGSPTEGRAVEGLVGLLEHDPEVSVRRHAATALRWLEYGEDRHARVGAAALERQADAADPEIRAHSIADALRRGAPDAYDRFLAELESPDVHGQLLAGLMNAPTGSGFALPSRSVRKTLIERLEALREAGWADRDAPGAAGPASPSPDSARPNVEVLTAADRAELLSGLIEALRDL